MKKILSILCCAVVLMTVSSCTKQYVTPPVTTNQTIFKTINPSDWILSEDGKSYYAPLKIAAISSDFNHYGGIIVSIWFPGVNTDEVYEQLPEVFGGTSYSYTYNAGNVAMYAQSSDGNTPVAPTDVINAKIILVDSN